MPRRFVDLSIYLENDVPSDPPGHGPKIQYFSHENTFEQIAPFFPGLKKEDLPDAEGRALEQVTLIAHNGSHRDAPYPFHSTMDAKLGGKKPSIAIDEVPLERCFQPGVKLDFRHLADGHVEKLHKLEPLPADGFFISGLPHKIRGASAGWTRAVAIFDDALMASG